MRIVLCGVLLSKSRYSRVSICFSAWKNWLRLSKRFVWPLRKIMRHFFSYEDFNLARANYSPEPNFPQLVRRYARWLSSSYSIRRIVLHRDARVVEPSLVSLGCLLSGETPHPPKPLRAGGLVAQWFLMGQIQNKIGLREQVVTAANAALVFALT